jgi:hypothetical protein
VSDLLYVERETCPSVIPGEEIMVFSRDRGTPGASPRFFIVALAPGTRYQVRTGQGPMIDAFTTVTTSSLLDTGQRETHALTASVTADHNVYVLRCLSGRLAVTIVSPHEVQMQFRSTGQKSA